MVNLLILIPPSDDDLIIQHRRQFEAAIKAFTSIVSQPKDDDLQGVKKVLLQTCLSIRIAGLKSGKVTGLVLPNAAYKNLPGVTISLDKDNTPLD